MKKIVKASIILTLIIGAGFYLGVKFGFIPTQKERYFYKKLTEFAESGKKEILLKELTNFEWDAVCLIMPYGGINNKNLRNFELDRNLPSDDESKYSMVFFQINGKRGVVMNFNRNMSYVIQSIDDKGFCKDRDQSLITRKDNKIILN